VAEYGSFHRHPVNRALHVLGIPLLGIGSLGLLSQLAIPVGVGVPALEPNAAWLSLLVAAGWYLVLDCRAGWPVLAIIVACYAVGSFLPGPVLVGLWVTGAVTHLVGHYGFEGKPPAFLYTPLAVLEAPAWLLFLLAGGGDERPENRADR
jgi:uncharacterized membrane protein YGL010W